MLIPRNSGGRGRTPRPRLPIRRVSVGIPKEASASGELRLRVLLVEDDKAVAESTKRLLELEGFVVTCAFDGKAGLAKALSGSDNVILLDRMLPGLSGDQVIERLRTSGKSTPVIMLTGFPDYGSALRAGRFDVSAYLVKSAITGAELSASIRKAAAKAVTLGAGEAKAQLFAPHQGTSTRSFSELSAFVWSDDIQPDGLMCVLARVLSARDLTFTEFLAASKSLHLLNRKAHLPFDVALSTLRDWLSPAAVCCPLDPSLEALLTSLEAAGADSSKATIALVNAKGRSTDLIDHRIALAHPTPNQCRRAVVMRRAVFELLRPHEQIRQIAYRLGYSDHGNFDHDFMDFFSLSPRRFRRLV